MVLGKIKANKEVLHWFHLKVFGGTHRSENQGFLLHFVWRRQNEQCSELHCVSIINAGDLNPIPRTQDRTKRQLWLVRPHYNSIDIMDEPHVSDGENKGELASSAELLRYFLSKSCS